MQDLVRGLRAATSGNVCAAAQNAASAMPSGFPAPARVPVAVGESSQHKAGRARERLQRCESMSLHLSDACSLSPPASPPAGQPSRALDIQDTWRGARSATSHAHYSGTQAGAVAESSNWSDDDWGDGWGDPGQGVAAAAETEGSGWGAAGWEDSGDWIDATDVGPSTAPRPAAAPPAASPGALSHGPVPQQQLERVAPEVPAAAVPAMAQPSPPPRSTTSGDSAQSEGVPVKKKKLVVKKVPKKVVKIKPAEGSDATDNVQPDVSAPMGSTTSQGSAPQQVVADDVEGAARACMSGAATPGATVSDEPVLVVHLALDATGIAAPGADTEDRSGASQL